MITRKSIIKNKRSQAQVITTVLLILISIAAIAIVSTVIINFVRNRLTFTECFDTLGQLEIDVDSGFTYSDPITGLTHVMIKRGPSKNFNLTGVLVSLETTAGADPFELVDGEVTPGNKVFMYSSASGSSVSTIVLPSPGGKRTYTFVLANVTGIEIAPILDDGKQCDPVDSTQITVKECKKSCSGKVCGDLDGCGGGCTSCSGNETCNTADPDINNWACE